MLDALALSAVEQEIESLLTEGSATSVQRAEQIVQRMEALVEANKQMASEPVQQKLAVVVEGNPWMAPERVGQELAKIASENASIRSKRHKVIAIANRVMAALEPHVACQPGCSSCCHMNTLIYEHEAIRLAEVSGRKMKRMEVRPRDVILIEGRQFEGKPCPFLVKNRCSVYEDRPLVCRTHHSLREDASQCSKDIPSSQQVRPPMYDPDILERPYIELNTAHNPAEPWGNIAEFFPD